MSKLNVLFLNSWYPNKVYKENGNFVQEHAKAVSKYCNVYCLHIQNFEQTNPFEIEINDSSSIVEVIVYYKQIKSNFPIALIKKKRIQNKAFKLGYNKIISFCKKIDIVHVNVAFPAGIFAMYLNKKYNIPFILTEHNTKYLSNHTNGFSNVEKFFIKRIISKATVICPVSDLLKTEMIKSDYNGNYNVVANVIDTDEFKYKEKSTSNTHSLLHISSLKNEHKNIFGILDTINELSKIRQDFTFTIASSSANEHVIEYANKINLKEEFLEFTVAKTPKDVSSLMKKSDLFILFSNYETFSLVIAESLACGTPVITTNVGVVPELVSNKNGFIIKKNNTTNLLNGILKVLDGNQNFDRKSIAKETEDQFSYSTIGNKFYQIYNQILKS